MSFSRYDVVVIGAGAAGLMCAGVAVKRGRRVAVLDHADTIGEKIRISGGGRCNFTNLHCCPERFISDNPHFCKSALSQYTQHDFIALVDLHGIAWHEKTLGQLFCDGSAQQIIDMLLSECAGAEIRGRTVIRQVAKQDGAFRVSTDGGDYECISLVVATGGLSIPKIGASGFGYALAEQFGLDIVAPRAALVPLTFQPELLALTGPLSGIGIDPARISCGGTHFDEAMLFTHRGLSGPAILQISSYWENGDDIFINLAPRIDVLQHLKTMRQSQGKKMLRTVLADMLPQRLADMLVLATGIDGIMGDMSDKKLQSVCDAICAWRIKPGGSEGYRTAEVTRGGVNTAGLSSKTMEARSVPGLYFIGEVVDVTGWLGGYNFQWAWSSGWCAGTTV